MAHKKQQAAWYSVTLNLGRILEVAPAVPVGPAHGLTVAQATLAYTPVPATRYGWER